MSSLGPLPLLHPGGLAAKLEASYLKYRQDQPNRAAVARIARIEEEYHKYLKNHSTSNSTSNNKHTTNNHTTNQHIVDRHTPNYCAMPHLIETGAARAGNDAAVFADREPIFEPFTVVSQSVHLDLRFREKQIIGTVVLEIFRQQDDLEYITLDARQCEIDQDAVTVNNQNVRVEYSDPYKLMDTPKGFNWGARQHHLRADRMRPLQPTPRAELPLSIREQKGCQPAVGSLKIWLRPEGGKYKLRLPQTPALASAPSNLPKSNTLTVTIPYKITNVRDGLHFAGVEDGDDRYPHAFSRHSAEPGYASCLFPCVDDRTRLAQWRISLTFPKTIADALGQALASHPVAQSNLQDPNGNSSLTEDDKLLEMTAVCSGTLVGTHEKEGTKTMEFEARNCGAHHVGFAIGPFEDVDLYSRFRTEADEQDLGGQAVKIHGYCLPGRREAVENACEPLALAADYFVLTFTKYPFDELSYKMCFVDDMVDDTVPLMGFSLISNRLLYTKETIDTELDVTRKLVHTIASQYFGIFMQPDKLTDTWIVIGLAYYMTDLFFKKLAGHNYYRYQMRTSAERLTQMDYGRPALHDLGQLLHLGDFEMEFMALKATLVIYILDKRLMKSSNSIGITRVISQLIREAKSALDSDTVAASVISTGHFRKYCEKRGKLRLEEFWDQWVHSSGCPRFSVTQRFNKKQLQVEVTVLQNQVKWAQEPRKLEERYFWRDIIEERHNVEASEVPLTFTGPMTFRVHEADGTPYEHCLEIKLDASATKGSRLSMPYNTKYKRIKRNHQSKKGNEHGRGPRDPDQMDEDGYGEDEDHSHGPSIFGNVLVSADDMASWRLVDWDEHIQNEMKMESYEWIRVDCDFEWIYDLETNFKVYMTVAQLQQDRDVAGQVEAMVALTQNPPSNIQTTMLLRTLYDHRYFYGIRCMAARALTRHAEPANKFRGMHHLIRVFKQLYCFPGTGTPRPNNFSSKNEYYLQAEIPMALAKIRGGLSFCPQEARQLILDQLIFNNDDDNPYSGEFYVAKLLEALATSLMRTNGTDGLGRRGLDTELKDFVAKAMEQFDRYEKMDEWMHTHDNIWTVTALDCKMRLMKAGVIDNDATTFLRYCLDENSESVYIKAFEALTELGHVFRPVVMKLMVMMISTHRSPYVRDQLFKVFTRGLAAIAFGDLDVTELRKAAVKAVAAPINPEGNDDSMEDDDDEPGIVIANGDDIIKRKQDKIARQKDITKAIKALKEALENDEVLEKELWKALDSDLIGAAEKRNLLELCALLFPEEHEMTVTMQYPVRWSVKKGNSKPGRSLVMHFTKTHKTAVTKKPGEIFPKEEAAEAFSALQAVPPALAQPSLVTQPPTTVAREPQQEKDKEKQPERKKIKISRLGTSNQKIAQPSPAPASRIPSMAVSGPRPVPSVASSRPVPSVASSRPVPSVASSRPVPSVASSRPVPSVAPSRPVPPAASPRPAPAVASSRPTPYVATPRPTPYIATPRPGPQLDRSDSISVLNRSVAQFVSAAPSVGASPTSDPARPMVNAKTAKMGKKRKLAETEAPEAASGRPRKMIKLKYQFARLTEQQQLMLSSFPSASPQTAAAVAAAAADSIVVTPAARSRLQATSPLPPNAEASSFASSSSSHTLAASQQTPLPTGRVRKPLPSGPSASVEPAGAQPALSSPGLSRPRKIVKLKLTTQVLRDAAAACVASIIEKDI